MSLEAFLSRRLLIISGKGGAGKSSVAAAAALLAAKHQKRTLLAEVEGRGTLAQLLTEREGRKDSPLQAPRDPLQVAPSLWLQSIHPEDALREYLSTQFHMGRLARVLTGSQLIYYVTTAAPGLRDILVLGKLWYSLMREDRYDIVVLDTPATGHALSMLRSPAGFLDAVSVGPVAGHSRTVTSFLQDQQSTCVHLVATPEEMSVTETIQTATMLAEMGIRLETAHMNAMYPDIFSIKQEREFMDPEVRGNLFGPSQGNGERKPEQDRLSPVELGEFYIRRKALQKTQAKRLRAALHPHIQIARLAYLFTRHFARAQVEELSRQLEEQLTAPEKADAF